MGRRPKPKTELDNLKKEWHDNVIDDTPDEKFVAKADREEDDAPIYEEPPKLNGSSQERESLPVYIWTDDWTQLSEVTKTNKELRGYGANRKFVTIFYGPLK